MNAGNLTRREAEIIHQLLKEKGITMYEIEHVVPEGKALPGSIVPDEVEELSGSIVTLDAAYQFWLDWERDHYIFSSWHEGSPELVRKVQSFAEARRRLQRRVSSS